jgi:hypothetical protein
MKTHMFQFKQHISGELNAFSVDVFDSHNVRLKDRENIMHSIHLKLKGYYFTHTHTHANTHAYTHTHTHTRTPYLPCSSLSWQTPESFHLLLIGSRSWSPSVNKAKGGMGSVLCKTVCIVKCVCCYKRACECGLTRDRVSLLPALRSTFSMLLIWISSQETLHSWATSSFSSFSFLCVRKRERVMIDCSFRYVNNTINVMT